MNSKDKFPWPQKGDRLFTYDSDWWHNACLNMNCSWDIYATGYKTGADILVKHVLATRSEQDFLIYPIVFLYRQFIELQLKELIRDGSRLINEAKEIPNHHDIMNLWVYCRNILERVWPEGDKKDLDAVEECIKEFSNIDPKSMSFRYPLDKKGKPSLPRELSHINIRNLGEVMQRLGSLLEGSAAGISEMLEWKKDMESSY